MEVLEYKFLTLCTTMYEMTPRSLYMSAYLCKRDGTPGHFKGSSHAGRHTHLVNTSPISIFIYMRVNSKNLLIGKKIYIKKKMMTA
jgi:hypothetical protein